MQPPEPPPIIRVAAASPPEANFVRFAALQYQRGRFPVAIAAVVGLLAAAALSWFKPTLGTRGLVGIALGTAVLVAGALTVYLSQVWYAYFIDRQRVATGRNGRLAAALLSVLAIALIPVIAVCVAEYFGPPSGIARGMLKSVALEIPAATRSPPAVESVDGAEIQAELPFAGSEAAARKELLATAQKYEGAFTAAIVRYIELVEAKAIPISTADSAILYGSGGTHRYTPETKQAYQKWRQARMASTK